MQKLKLALASLALISSDVMAEEPVDLDMVGKIMDEGFNRSHVMETVYHLTDVIVAGTLDVDVARLVAPHHDHVHAREDRAGRVRTVGR